MKGILGRKLGMTQVFTIEGTLIPVTVIDVKPNVVLQKKTKEVDGYEAVQLGYEDVKEQRSNKPAIGHAKKANTAPKHYIKELRADEMMMGNDLFLCAGNKHLRALGKKLGCLACIFDNEERHDDICRHVVKATG